MMREGHGELYYYFTCAYSRSFNICVYITSGLVFARARVKLNLVLFQGHMKFALAWRPWMLSMDPWVWILSVFFVILIKKLRPLPVELQLLKLLVLGGRK